MASNCAQALERARLNEESENARRRAEVLADRVARLQNVTAQLSKALTPPEVAQTVVDQGVAALGAKAGVVFLLSEDKTALEIMAAYGYAPETLPAANRWPMDTPIPVVDTVKTGQAIWIETMDTYYAEYAFVATVPRLERGARATIPLQMENDTIGAIGLSFAEDRPFSHDDKQFILTLADQCAQALVRAKLYESEHQARAAAEIANTRSWQLHWHTRQR